MRGIGWLRGGAESAGLRTGAVGVWVYAHKQALRIGAVAAAGHGPLRRRRGGAFAAVGWGWGGFWEGAKDYVHFSSTGR